MNKLNFEPLKEIMKKMGIDESVKPNIEILEKRKITWKKISDFSGLDININDVTCSKDGYIEYEGFSKLIAYIKDQKFYIDTDFNNSNNLKKFHIAYNCKTLDDARKSKEANKYKIVLNKSPKFSINIFLNGRLIDRETVKKLQVCKNCLKILNYKNFNEKSYNEKENIVNNFSFEEFLGEEFDKNEKDFKD